MLNSGILIVVTKKIGFNFGKHSTHRGWHLVSRCILPHLVIIIKIIAIIINNFSTPIAKMFTGLAEDRITLNVKITIFSTI